MQLLGFQRETGLDAVCWTYWDFTFYKQTPSTFRFSLSPLDVTLDVTPDNSHERRQRCKSCLFPWALSHGAASATAMGSWPCFRSRGTVRNWAHPHVHGTLLPLRTLRSRSVPGSFTEVLLRHRRAAQPWPQDLPGENPTTRLEKPMLNPLYWARGGVLVGGADDAKKASGRSEASASSLSAGYTVTVGQFIPKSFLLAGGVELTGGDLPLTHQQHLRVGRRVAARKPCSPPAPLHNTPPKSNCGGDPGVSRPALSSVEDVSLHPSGVSSIFICFFLLPFPLTFQTWDTGSYYSFSCFLPAVQQRAALSI